MSVSRESLENLLKRHGVRPVRRNSSEDPISMDELIEAVGYVRDSLEAGRIV
jgi:hypothetical protein